LTKIVLLILKLLFVKQIRVSSDIVLAFIVYVWPCGVFPVR